MMYSLSSVIALFSVLRLLQGLFDPRPLSAMPSLRIYGQSLCMLVPLWIGFQGLDAYLSSTPATVNFTDPPPVLFSPILDIIPHPLFPNYTPLLDALEAHSSKPMVHLHWQSTSPWVSVATLLDELVPPSPTPMPVADDLPTTVASALSISPSLALIYMVMLLVTVALAAAPVARRTATSTVPFDIDESMALVVLGEHRDWPSLRVYQVGRTRSLFLTSNARLLITFPMKSCSKDNAVLQHVLIASPPTIVLATDAPGEMVDTERHVLHLLAEEIPPPRCSDRIRSTSENPSTCHPPLPETLLLFAPSSSSRSRTCTAPGHIINISATMNPAGTALPHITPFDGSIPPPPSPLLATPRAPLADTILTRPVTLLIIYETPAPRRPAPNHPRPHLPPKQFVPPKPTSRTNTRIIGGGVMLGPRRR
ncbi:hypothetical protein FB45DRAFT_1023025 [Roridomyces roridus]|uniref:Uncharacterized protein n=1 Tax=Roridomyces roridus TaxID=1738132 RepID=A0AAD7FUH2_9AGAR|nr:hypothetical protein FB45DRAFT_1023025 [Roridomyces roridus]